MELFVNIKEEKFSVYFWETKKSSLSAKIKDVIDNNKIKYRTSNQY